FEYLYAQERLGLLHIAFHGHFGGRPLMSAMLAKTLRHLSAFSDVWFVRHDELAEWFGGMGLEEIPSARRFVTK
ncbi:MAG TPA: hypothetical protein VFB75_07940, partial [Burkholderiales bacterium]|nr:hypothetical protein [Burkholderiales bacterium]